MRFEHEFPSKEHWFAYVAGFYRGCGYEGSGNRRQRKHAKQGLTPSI